MIKRKRLRLRILRKWPTPAGNTTASRRFALNPRHIIADRNYRAPLAASPSGFTIVELMIATMVFAVVLLLVTAGILQVARVFYKGLTEANTQSAARSIIDDISHAIQFSGGDVDQTATSPVAGNDYAFCINNNQISYKPGYQVKNNPSAPDQTWHAIVSRTVSGCSGLGAQTLGNQTLLSGSRDLLGQNMRLSNLEVTSLGDNKYRVTVRVAYGDSDLLYSPSAPSDPAGATRPDATCRPVRAGTQFCAISELSTLVVKRVQ